MPRGVGAPFAVLVAEELFVAGCQLLLSVMSAGQVAPLRPPPYFVLIDRALRDGGTSYHYLPASEYSQVVPRAVCAGGASAGSERAPDLAGASWTTDAPFRETEAAIAARRARGILAVDMESAALYAFARGRDVLCVAHVTNQMGREGDVELAMRAARSRRCDSSTSSPRRSPQTADDGYGRTGCEPSADAKAARLVSVC